MYKMEGAIFRGKNRSRHDDTAVSCANMAEEIEMPIGLWTRVGPRKHNVTWGAHWRNLANASEPSMFEWVE